MVLPLIPLMGKKTFQTFLQALVVRSVALKREFISIPRWQQLSDDGILYSLLTSSMHCSVFGDVLIHDISSAREGAQALNIYVNRLIDWLIDWLVGV